MQRSDVLRRASLRGIVILSVVLALPAAAGEPVLVGKELLVPSFPHTVSPATGETKDWKILRLTRAGEKRYLALVEYSRWRLDRWADKDRMAREREQEGVVTAKMEVREGGLTLAILTDRGKITQQAAVRPEAQDSLSPYPGSHSLPLLMEQSERCPYAILHPFSSSLLCYDYQLAFKEKHDIPLHEIGTPRVTFDGVAHTLWIFGKRYAQRPEVRSFEDAYRMVPQGAEAYGVRFRVQDASWEPLPIDGALLLPELERLARSPGGGRVRLAPASVQITPFRDMDEAGEFGVLIEAVASERFQSPVAFAGTRHFFRSRLSAEGLGTIEQLPFWIVQEERDDVRIHEDGGTTVVHLSGFAKIQDLQVFVLAERRFGVVLDLWFKVRQSDGTYHPNRWSSLPLLAVFAGTSVARLVRLDDDTVLDAAVRPLSRGNRWVAPVKLVDRVGKYDFAFWALCGSAQHPRQSDRCLAIMTLRD